MAKTAENIPAFTLYTAAKLRQILPDLLREHPDARAEVRKRLHATRGSNQPLSPHENLEAHALYMPVMDAVFHHPQLRKTFVEKAYLSHASQETEHATRFQTDVLVIGGGPNGIAAALSAKREHPDWKVSIIDRRDKLAGPFGAATYTLNTPNSKRSKAVFDAEDTTHPNTLGTDAFVQLRSFAHVWPTSNDVHDIAMGNAHFVDQIRLHTAGLTVLPGEKDRATVLANDTKTGNDVIIEGVRVILYAPGMGPQGYGKIDVNEVTTQKALVSRADHIYATETWMAALEEMTREEAKKLVEQGITFVGGNDSVKMTMAKLIEKLDEKTIANNHIRLIGTRYTTQDEYEQLTFMPMPTYRSLHRFFPAHLDDTDAFIQPTQDRVVGFFEAPNGQIGITIQSKDSGEEYTETTQTIVCATGYENRAMELLADVVPSGDMNDLETVYADFPDAPHVAIGRKVRGHHIYLLGAGADIQPSQRELQNGRNERPTLRRMVPRSSELARYAVQKAQEEVA